MHTESPTLDPELPDLLLGGLVVVSPEGEILSWNRGAEILYGYSRDEALHRSIFELIVPPALAEETREQIKRSLAIGAAMLRRASRIIGTGVVVEGCLILAGWPSRSRSSSPFSPASAP